MTGFFSPRDLAVADNFLYVSSYSSGKIGKYSTDAGNPSTASFMTGMQGPSPLALGVPEPTITLLLLSGTVLLGLQRRKVPFISPPR